MSAARALATLVAAGVEVRAEGADLRLVGARGAVGPELRAELPAVAPALHLVASGRWRKVLEDWPEVRRDEWEERTAAYTFGAGISAELAQRVAFLEVSALPEPPAVPPEAACQACGVFSPPIASGLGSCEACGVVPRFVWPWSKGGSNPSPVTR